LYLRGEDLKRTYVDVSGFEPYAAYPIDEPVPNSPDIARYEEGLTGIYNTPLRKIVYYTPDAVSRNRKHFNKRYEDDIRFVSRLLIDTGVTSGIDLDYARSTVHYTDLQPADFSLPPVKVGWDIECLADTRIPNPENPDQKITALTFWNDITYHYDSILLDDMNKVTQMADDWTIYHMKDEKQLLQMGIRYLEKIQPDVLFEWGSLDEEYFPPRAKLHNVDTSVFRTFCVFNAIEAYKNLYKKGSNRLKDVAFDEKIIDYLPPEVNFYKLWKYDRMQLILKNKLDVEWMVKLNDLKGNLVRFFWNLKNYSGLESIQETTWHGMLVDTGLLRKYHGLYMFPSRPSKDEQATRKKLIGAIIKFPPKGLFENIAILDFSRYYQNLLIGILRNSGEPRVQPLADLAQELQDVRDAYDKRLASSEKGSEEYYNLKGVRDSVKYVGEAVIGYIGGKRARWYEPEIFEEVITNGRNGLLFAEERCQKKGFKVLYYDTDGLDAQVGVGGSLESAVQKSLDLVHDLNDDMAKWSEENSIGKALKLKVDNFSDRTLYTGKKKRKAYHVVWEDGEYCDYLVIKGFESIRRDSSLVTRNVQREVFEHLLRRGMEGLRLYLNTIIKGIKFGDFSLREVALSKSIKHKWEYYGKGGKAIPEHVRGSLWSNKYLDAGIEEDDQVKMIYVKRTPGYPSTNIVCFLDEHIIPKNFVIDWEKMIERTIEKKVSESIEQGGLGWGEVMGMKKLSGVFV